MKYFHYAIDFLVRNWSRGRKSCHDTLFSAIFSDVLTRTGNGHERFGAAVLARPLWRCRLKVQTLFYKKNNLIGINIYDYSISINFEIVAISAIEDAFF